MPSIAETIAEPADASHDPKMEVDSKDRTLDLDPKTSAMERWAPLLGEERVPVSRSDDDIGYTHEKIGDTQPEKRRSGQSQSKTIPPKRTLQEKPGEFLPNWGAAQHSHLPEKEQETLQNVPTKSPPLVPFFAWAAQDSKDKDEYLQNQQEALVSILNSVEQKLEKVVEGQFSNKSLIHAMTLQRLQEKLRCLDSKDGGIGGRDKTNQGKSSIVSSDSRPTWYADKRSQVNDNILFQSQRELTTVMYDLFKTLKSLVELFVPLDTARKTVQRVWAALSVISDVSKSIHNNRVLVFDQLERIWPYL